jgi:hypothetical protein
MTWILLAHPALWRYICLFFVIKIPFLTGVIGRLNSVREELISGDGVMSSA